MTEVVLSGAPDAPIRNTDWRQICWDSIEKNVYRLQMRIAKAVSNKQFGKAKSLQWLLVNSASAKLLAVRRVTSAKGSKTPGTDGVVWKSNDKYPAALSLKARGYKAQPLRRIYILRRTASSVH